jgi:hypothetical protein
MGARDIHGGGLRRHSVAEPSQLAGARDSDVDRSFFPSSAAVNPALTIMANALRVGDHLIERMN